jgi:hypothetical protein
MKRRIVRRQPTCAHCGKKYGKRATQTIEIVQSRAQATPTYQGDGKVLLESVTSHGHSKLCITRSIWNGKYITPYGPFCSMRCGWLFGVESLKKRRQQ